MMSKKQWFVLFCLFVFYLLLGASIFFYVESYEEIKNSIADLEDKQIIEELMKKHCRGDNQSLQHIFNRLSDYCGKPVSFKMTASKPEYKWDFYHSLFFVVTVVSTIGYGNLAPTTMFTRIFMIFYGLIGIPMNGILMVALGEYFGKSFTKLYKRWKNTRINKSSAKLGLIGQIILYAVPGLTFFIFLPSTIISVFEGWDYYEAVYFSFVTLTTIGFGDFVAGGGNMRNFNPVLYRAYEIFLLIWVIGGLGYLVMIIGFITQGMRHRKVIKIEKILAENIRKTPQKIRHELRSLLQEFLFRVKPVYKDDLEFVPHVILRSQSCPDLTIWKSDESPSMKRKRAMSECVKYPLLKVQSETELERIDKDRTFRPSDALMRQKDLILKVVDALSQTGSIQEPEMGIHGFSDSQILASEQMATDVAFKQQRRRAVSDVRPPRSLMSSSNNIYTWYGEDANTALKEFKQQMSIKATSDERMDRPGILKRIRNRFNIFKDDNKPMDIEKQNLDDTQEKKHNIMTTDRDVRRPSFFQPNREERRASFFVPTREELSRRLPSITGIQNQHVLEQTSIADFIRALSAITVPEEERIHEPRRKLGTASLTPPMNYSPPQRRTSGNQFNSRRPSFIPTPPKNIGTKRRCSLMPVEENVLSHLPPPYSEATKTPIVSNRRFSIRPTNLGALNTSSPVKYQLNKRKKDSESEK